ncbi:helix-turn-helix domain-containing protein [Listeria kieliensis]
MSQKVHNYKNYGSTIRKIRESKGLTQKQVAGTIPLSTYRKIELNQTVCTLPAIDQILENLNMEPNDFKFIHREFSLTERQKLHKLFLKIKSTLHQESFLKFFSSCDAYLQKHNDTDMKQLRTALEGLYQYSLTEDRDACYQFVKPLWDKMITQEWYYWEALTVSCILFCLHEPKEIHKTTQQLVKTFERFHPLHDSTKAIIKVYLNSAYGLKCGGHILEAEPYVQKALEMSETIDKALYFDTLYKKAEIEFVKGNMAYSKRLATESFEGLQKYEIPEGENSFLNDNKTDWLILTQKKSIDD